MTSHGDHQVLQPLSQLPVVLDARRPPSTGGSLGKQALAFGSMIVGTALVLGLVLAMNSALEPPKAELVKAATDFTVEKKPPPTKTKAPKPKEAKKVKSSSAPRAPLPNLGSAVGGVEFDLPGVEGVDLGAMSQSLLGDANRETAMTSDAVDEPAKPIGQIAPEYPDRARERGVEGYVKMRAKVTSSGSVTAVRVVEANPKGIFDQSAVAALRQMTFEPALYQGRPTETLVDLTVNFRLN